VNRIYTYKRFEVRIDLEPVWHPSAGVTLRSPKGFLAILNISMPGAIFPLVTPIRLADTATRPFPTEADAFMAAYSAAQRFIEDKLDGHLEASRK
jgi:hypothetical protein